MLRLDYSDGHIIISGDIFNFMQKNMKYAWLEEKTGIVTCWWTYLDELSDLIGQCGDKDIDLTKSFKKFAAFFREHYCEEYSGGTKGEVVLHVHVNKTKIISRKFPRELIDKKTKYFFKPARRQKKFIEGKWDGYIHLYNARERTFPTGLLSVVKEVLEKEGYSWRVIYKYKRRPDSTFEWTVDDGITPDPDQIEAVRMAWEAGRSVVKAPTGFGKVA